MFYKKTILITISYLIINGFIFCYYWLFPNVNFDVLNLMALPPLLLIGLIVMIKNSTKKENTVINIESIFSQAREAKRSIIAHIKFLLIYTGSLVILFACIAKNTFPADIGNRIEFQDILSLYSLNVSVTLFSLIFGLVFLGLTKVLKKATV